MPIEDSFIPKSVYVDAQSEADKHKWLESEKNGCDLGPQATFHPANRHLQTICLRAFPNWPRHP